MKNKLIKALLITFGLFLSPFIVIGVLGGLFILFQVIGGTSIKEGYEIVLEVIKTLKPYFPYLTFGPVLSYSQKKTPSSKHFSVFISLCS